MPADPIPRLILVDTSAYFALADRTDRHHRSAVAFVRENDIPLVTTDLIVVETLNLVQGMRDVANYVNFRISHFSG